MTSPSLCTCRERSVNLVRKASGSSCSSLRPDSTCKWVFCQSLSEFPLDFSGLWHQIATLTWRNSLERTFFLIQIKTCTFRFCLFLSPHLSTIPPLSAWTGQQRLLPDSLGLGQSSLTSSERMAGKVCFTLNTSSPSYSSSLFHALQYVQLLLAVPFPGSRWPRHD